MGWRLAAVVLLFGAGLARAEEGLSTFRPMPRPLAAQPALNAASAIRPQPRPSFATAAVAVILPPIRPLSRPALAAVLPPITPLVKPLDEPQVELAVKPQKPAKSSMKGAVCQRPEIKGKALPPIRAANKGCNVPDAVLVSQVAGVVLNPPATINCEEAIALSTWVTTGLQPAFNNAILALNVADSYACRPRNNVPGNKVSVHGLGQAIDISGFVTKSGRTYTVAQSYNAQIRAAQKAGCGIFSTILGPGSDGYHENHIHFDVSRHGGRDYCH